MAAAITARGIDLPSNARITLLAVVADAAYPTGGYDLSAALPTNTVFVVPSIRYVSGTGGGLVPVYNPATRKLALFESSTGAPLALVEAAASSVHVTTSTVIDVMILSVT